MHANQRRKRNHNVEVTNANGVSCASLDFISNAFLGCYQSLFSSSRPSGGDDCLASLEEKVTNKMNDQLALEFIEEEVCTTISPTDPYNSPGLDSFSPCFYQKFWPVIREVCKTILFCLNSGRSLETINDTNIFLIPKKNISSWVTDFRPISLCHVIYNLVAKVIANRLKCVLPHIISPKPKCICCI